MKFYYEVTLYNCYIILMCLIIKCLVVLTFCIIILVTRNITIADQLGVCK